MSDAVRQQLKALQDRLDREESEARTAAFTEANKDRLNAIAKEAGFEDHESYMHDRAQKAGFDSAAAMHEFMVTKQAQYSRDRAQHLIDKNGKPNVKRN